MHSVRLLSESDCAHVALFVCEQFMAGSVLHCALNIQPAQYLEYIEAALPVMVREGLSFVAIDDASEAVIACILAGEFSVEAAVNESVPEFLKPIRALTDLLEARYRAEREIVPNSTVLVDIAVVGAAVRGRGIYRQLRMTVHAQASHQGFKRVIGELSSGATQQMCIQQLGHQLVCGVDYSSFEHDGAFPFARILDPSSIQLAECSLV